MNAIIRAILGLVVLFAAGNALGQTSTAQIVIMPAVMYISHDDSANTITTKDTDTTIVFDGGYKWSNNLYLGLKYMSGTITAKTDTSTATLATSGIGVGFGYIMPNWFSVIGTYFINQETKVSVETTALAEGRYYGGTGIALDFGLHLGSGAHFKYGPRVLYNSVDYKSADSTAGGVTTTTSLTGTWKDTWIKPLFGFWWFI